MWWAGNLKSMKNIFEKKYGGIKKKSLYKHCRMWDVGGIPTDLEWEEKDQDLSIS